MYNLIIDETTILGQAVNDILNTNEYYYKATVELIIDIYNEDYLTPTESQVPIIITNDIFDITTNKHIILTHWIEEMTWFVEQLYLIYVNDITNKNKNIFFSTLTTICNSMLIEDITYSKNKLETTMEHIAITIIAWLHPLHVKDMVFKTPHIKFPTKPLI